MEAWVRGLLRKYGTPLERVRFHHFPAYEPWCRDHGPIFVAREHNGSAGTSRGGLGLQCLGQQVSAVRSGRRHPAARRQIARAAAVFSGHRDGRRLDRSQRPGHGADHRGVPAQSQPQSRSSTKAQIEQYLRDYLGVTNVLWLGEGIVGDDTDGHIDDLTRFVNPTTVVTAVEEDPADANYELLQENLKRLRGLRDQDGKPLRIVELPMPGLLEYEGPAFAGQLREFLHRQPDGGGPDVPPRQRRKGAGDLAKGISGPAGHRNRFDGIDLGPGLVSLHQPAGTQRDEFSIFDFRFSSSSRITARRTNCGQQAKMNAWPTHPPADCQ